MAVALYGTLTAPKWGCTDESNLGIIITNFDLNTEREETTLNSGQNDIVHVAYHAEAGEATCDFKVAATGYPDADLVGAAVTITDPEFAGKYIVRSVGNTKTSTDFMTGSMTLRIFELFDGDDLITTTSTTTTTTTSGL
jgi:phosphoribosylamine-glycine ligase